MRFIRSLAYILAGVSLIPLIFLVFKASQVDIASLKDIFSLQLVEIFTNVFGLGALIVLGSLILGTSLGYIFSHYHFTFKKIFFSLLLLPLAFPMYVYTFSFLGLREIWFDLYTKPSWLLCSLFILATSPYVFFLTYIYFKEQNSNLWDVHRSLGRTRRDYFKEIQFPLLLPVLASAGFLVWMEFLSDYGAVSQFPHLTFATAIYKNWVSYQSLEAASALSLLLLAMIFSFLVYFSKLQARFQYLKQTDKGEGFLKTNHNNWLIVLLLPLVIFQSILPLAFLLYQTHWDFAGILPYITNTFALSFCFAFILTGLSFLFVTALKSSTSIWQFGYALPGTLVAVAVIVPAIHIFGNLNVWLSIALIFYAWGLRFFRGSQQAFEQVNLQIPKSIFDAALLLESRYPVRVWSIHFPLFRRAWLFSFFWAFIEAVKELPIVLLLRPFGWETLSIKIFEWTAESLWREASLPSLILVFISGISVFVFYRREVI